MSSADGVIGIASLAGRGLGEFTAAYEDRDAVLYALAVGARASEIPLVYEEELEVLPTYALALGLWAVEAAGRLGAYDPVSTLHVSQGFEVLKPLPRSGEIPMAAEIGDVWDKKSAALIEVKVRSEWFTAEYGIWATGAGGFGGDRGPSSRRTDEPAPPNFRAELVTSPDQAALYRLTGDRHPLHILPSVAEAAGFEGPILHGLCVLGASVLSVARELGASPGGLRSLRARFAAPVYPGDDLRIAGLSQGATAEFEVMRGEEPVLSGCSIELERTEPQC